MPDKTRLDHETKNFVKTLSECSEVCLDTHTYCLELGGDHADPEHMNLMMDCDEICHKVARFALRQSKNTDLLVDACASICRQCADSCEGEHFKSDAVMQTCAEVCRECQEVCEERVR